jgi:hypothetical protein
MGGREAEVFGFVEMDKASGCVYLNQPEFGISYPVVWPAGTVVTDAGLQLGDGRVIPNGEWVYGGGGYFSLDGVEGAESRPEARFLERCPGVNNEYGEVAGFDSPARDIQIGE